VARLDADDDDSEQSPATARRHEGGDSLRAPLLVDDAGA
jgi:hypothetical protein